MRRESVGCATYSVLAAALKEPVCTTARNASICWMSMWFPAFQGRTRLEWSSKIYALRIYEGKLK